MPFLQIEDKRIPLLEGENRVGRGDGADVALPEASDGETGAVRAIITIGGGRSAAIRRAAMEARIDVNGLALGAQPSPLIHGDRLEIDGMVAVFGDEMHTGSTVEISSLLLPDAPAARDAAVAPRARLNGRVVSLVDGREYTVRHDGLTIGREPGCDIVIPAGDVSRRHARIELRSDGYVIVDISTNGILVNDVRIERSHPLARGDRIRIGSEELRFHADLEEIQAPVPPPPIILPPKPVTEAVPLLNTAPGGPADRRSVSAALATARTEETRAASQPRVPRFLILALIALALAVVYLFALSV
ncbi:MAG TPA: FHA domain-containing protein [Gemmatimonadaceae bacterium]|nr:FHA domain-containing protein [Gemmatimonadaceae bacterium]